MCQTQVSHLSHLRCCESLARFNNVPCFSYVCNETWTWICLVVHGYLKLNCGIWQILVKIYAFFLQNNLYKYSTCINTTATVLQTSLNMPNEIHSLLLQYPLWLEVATASTNVLTSVSESRRTDCSCSWKSRVLFRLKPYRRREDGLNGILYTSFVWETVGFNTLKNVMDKPETCDMHKERTRWSETSPIRCSKEYICLCFCSSKFS